MALVNDMKMDRTKIEVVTEFEDPDDAVYWRAQPVKARLEALELLRQIAYGYDPTTERLQRVLTVAKFEPR